VDVLARGIPGSTELVIRAGGGAGCSPAEGATGTEGAGGTLLGTTAVEGRGVAAAWETSGLLAESVFCESSGCASSPPVQYQKPIAPAKRTTAKIAK
jgi:hypothetical protein